MRLRAMDVRRADMHREARTVDTGHREHALQDSLFLPPLKRTAMERTGPREGPTENAAITPPTPERTTTQCPDTPPNSSTLRQVLGMSGSTAARGRNGSRSPGPAARSAV